MTWVILFRVLALLMCLKFQCVGRFRDSKPPSVRFVMADCYRRICLTELVHGMHPTWLSIQTQDVTFTDSEGQGLQDFINSMACR
ncbi:hypothetical protein [Methylocucumis oryzae]|uniref:hypothetical protein n=1 Tax=Methylocucumis oryzae TaxID=1632867 RepID=UPI0012FE83DA|nr:hypothetical protein [Methylocucumis oryzae]